MNSCSEEIQVSCNNTIIVIIVLQVNPKYWVMHIQTIDILYILTKYDNNSFKLWNQISYELGYSVAKGE